MNLSTLTAPRMDLKYIFLALFVYLAITAVLVIGPVESLPSATAFNLGVGPQSVSASTHVVVEIPEVRILTAPYIIVELAN